MWRNSARWERGISPWSLTCAHGVKVSVNHHLATFSKETLHLYSHVSFSTHNSHSHIGKSKTTFTIIVPKGLRLRIPSQKSMFSLALVGYMSAPLRAWHEKKVKEVREQLQFLSPLCTSEHIVQGGWLWSSSAFKPCFAILLRINYSLIIDLKSGSSQHIPCPWQPPFGSYMGEIFIKCLRY